MAKGEVGKLFTDNICSKLEVISTSHRLFNWRAHHSASAQIKPKFKNKLQELCSRVVEQYMQLLLLAHELLCGCLNRFQVRQIEAEIQSGLPCLDFQIRDRGLRLMLASRCNVYCGIVREEYLIFGSARDRNECRQLHLSCFLSNSRSGSSYDNNLSRQVGYVVYGEVWLGGKTFAEN